MRFWPRRETCFLDPEDEAWQAQSWAWLLRHFGGVESLRDTTLVTPTRRYFPPTDASGHERALHVFGAVKRWARMESWPCTLVAQPRRPDIRVGELAILKPDKPGPAGTFAIDAGEATVTYDPAQLEDPLALVATLIHELCHYRLALLDEPPPGGPEMAECATDLATVYFGFGVFGSACAFRFAQHGDTFSQGWRWARQGYLDRRNWCYALAVYFTLVGKPVDEAKPFLSPSLYTDLRGANSYLRSHPERYQRMLSAERIAAV